MADFLATYRLKLFTHLDYSTYIGLWLNLSRIRMQPAYAVMRGVKAAFAKSLPGDIFDAIAANDKEAEDLTIDANTGLAASRIRNASIETLMQGLL